MRPTQGQAISDKSYLIPATSLHSGSYHHIVSDDVGPPVPKGQARALCYSPAAFRPHTLRFFLQCHTLLPTSAPGGWVATLKARPRKRAALTYFPMSAKHFSLWNSFENCFHILITQHLNAIWETHFLLIWVETGKGCPGFQSIALSYQVCGQQTSYF